MASSAVNSAIAIFVSLIVVLILPTTSATELFSLSPLRPPTFDDVCKEVSCGNGNCSVTKNSTVPFECVCDPGWKQPPSLNGFHFLPCIVPNCTIDTSCAQAPPPAASPVNATKGSIFDPCSWNICGDGGTCTKSSSNSSYSCSCSQGHHNLLNSISLPCYPECGIGDGCGELNIPISNQTSPPSSTLNSNDGVTSSASLQHQKLSWIIILVVLLLIPLNILA